MNHGLTMLELSAETVSVERYGFGIDREKTIVFIPGEEKAYPLISSGPIAVGYELRGICKKRGTLYSFESDKVKEIVAKFTLNRLFA